MVKFRLKQRKLSKIAPFFLACLRGYNVTIIESSETYGKLKGPVQKLFSMICFHLHKVKFRLKQQKLSKIAPFPLACLKGYNVTSVESSETYGKLKGPVQKLFSRICFHLHKYKLSNLDATSENWAKLLHFP